MPDQYVKLAFFEGSKRKVFKLCELLGIQPWTTKQRKVRLTITASDKVTNEQLAKALNWWRNN